MWKCLSVCPAQWESGNAGMGFVQDDCPRLLGSSPGLESSAATLARLHETQVQSSKGQPNRSQRSCPKVCEPRVLGPYQYHHETEEKQGTRRRRRRRRRNETNHPDTTKQGEGNKKKQKKKNCARVTYWQHCARSFFILLFILLLIALVRLGRWTLDGQCSWQQR